MSKIKIFALGGLNDTGKNMYVVDVDKDVFIFDAGLNYADDRMLGVDYIIPNFDYVKENINRIKGIFLTHCHQLNMGAVTDIIMQVPGLKVYGTAFTLNLVKEELLEEKASCEGLIEIKPHQKIDFGSNSIFPISLTHSVPDNVGYVLYTPDGAIFYTGNYVFDPTMRGAFKTDIGKLAYVGKQGVLCMLSESLYAEKVGYTSPRHRVSDTFRDILSKSEGRILFNVDDSNLFRIQELLYEIEKTNKELVIMGKRLESMIFNCIEKSYIKFDKDRIGTIYDINKDVVIVISDDREKPFSNMKRIIRGVDKFIKIDETDTVVFTSRVYDGMEKTATEIHDNISKIGCHVIILSDKKKLGFHASSEDIMLMLDLIKPKYYFPVIGEYRHQVANAELAKRIGIKDEDIILKLNGQVALFENGKLLDTEETVKIDEILIDGKTIGDIGEAVIKDREALSADGIVVVTVTIDRQTKKILAGPEILTRGFIYVKENIDLIKEAEKISLEVVNENSNETYVDFNKVKMGIRDRVGKFLYKETECNPMILLVMQEV